MKSAHSHAVVTEAPSAGGWPPQIKYIIGNEAAERFSFYGMRSILVIFMTSYLAMPEGEATMVFHLFTASCYLMALGGAWLADRFLGKYETIFYLSLVYCAGHGVLAIWETQSGLYAGLGLIAIGAGGIKPCVSAHVGDQFGPSNRHLLKRVYDLFYWMINLGSFLATLSIPLVRRHFGPSIAFAIPGLLMALATWIFWLGRKRYVFMPPSGSDPHGFVRILFSALLRRPAHLALTAGVVVLISALLGVSIAHASGARYQRVANLLEWTAAAGGTLAVIAAVRVWLERRPLLDGMVGRFPQDRVEGTAATLRILRLFGAVSVFWALFDQHSSSWVLQARDMDRVVLGFELEPDQLPALNPVMVMALIPWVGLWLHPTLERRGIQLTPLRRMTVGMVIAAVSFVAVALLQWRLDAGSSLSVLWQIIPYLILTLAEVFISITGLEFAYTQAPPAMKSTIMSFWLLSVFLGNLITAYVEKLAYFQGAAQFLVYAALMGAAALLFAWLARDFGNDSRAEATLRAT